MNKTHFLYNDKIGKIELVQHMGDDVTVVNSARVSFGVQKQEIDDKDKKLINYLVKHKHTSTLEHNIATFRIKVPLFVRSQHHRHRTWSYNEISRRYTESNMSFYLPDSFRTQHKSNRQASNIEEKINPQMDAYPQHLESRSCSEVLLHHCGISMRIFEEMIEKGVAKEQARMILPQNLYTEYYATANLNNILKFISLRDHEGAQWEIQVLAQKMQDIVLDLWPITVESYMKSKNQKGEH